MIQAEQIQTTYKRIQEYEKSNFGIKNGPDFSAIAQTFSGTEAFKSLCDAASLCGMLIPLMMGRDKEASPEARADDMKKAMTDSPVRNVIADVFYLGYKLGQASVEIETLESIVK